MACGDWNPDLCDTGAALNKLSYKTNWELVIKVVSNISGKYENKIMYMYEFHVLQQRNEEINAKKIMSVVKTEKARKKR